MAWAAAARQIRHTHIFGSSQGLSTRMQNKARDPQELKCYVHKGQELNCWIKLILLKHFLNCSYLWLQSIVYSLCFLWPTAVSPGPILLSKLNYVQNQLLSAHPRDLQVNHINLNFQNNSRKGNKTRTIYKHLTGNITN